MITLITYDISNNATRSGLHRFLKEFGLNTQKSVFECDIDEPAIKRIRAYCAAQIDMTTDSVRIYRICSRCLRKVLLSGKGMKLTQLDYMVV
ncbi:MAG: CRISPR-associated endonuclease Cas2 [Desulfomonilia bacterium]|nr:CRISPR-associated endonuclease Cas2 [Desulfomonilia bacterium]